MLNEDGSLIWTKETTWREAIEDARHYSRDSSLMVSNTLTEDELGRPCIESVGISYLAWTAWTVERVYFPVCYDGTAWAGSVPRRPCDERTEAQGGG